MRNYVAILPLDDISNAACEAVAAHIQGTIALPHAYGRLQFGEDLELHFRTMIGTGANPNVAACIVIGIEPLWTQKVVDGIAKTGKPVAGFSIEGNGDIATVAAASRKAKEFVHFATEKVREECPLTDVWVAAKCGESDTTTGLASCPTVGNMYDKLVPLGLYGCFGETSELTGAEHLAAARAVSPEISAKFMKTWSAYQKDVIEAHKTSDLSDSQPTEGQHRRRPHHHRGESAGQPREDRQEDQVHRRAGAGRGARAWRGTLLHGHLIGSGRVLHAAGRRGLCGACLPDRTGQRHRQSRSCRSSRSAEIRARCVS